MYRANNSSMPGEFSDGRTTTSNSSYVGSYIYNLAGINNGSGSGNGRDRDNNENNSNPNTDNYFQLLQLESRIYRMLLLYLFFSLVNHIDINFNTNYLDALIASGAHTRIPLDENIIRNSWMYDPDVSIYDPLEIIPSSIRDVGYTLMQVRSLIRTINPNYVFQNNPNIVDLVNNAGNFGFPNDIGRISDQ